MKVSLVELEGMIANVAMESKGHQYALRRVRLLIRRFGPLRTVDTKWAIPLLYGKVKRGTVP